MTKQHQNNIRILFVCHGNICRSPMAEFILKDLVKKAGLSDHFFYRFCGYEHGGDRESGSSGDQGEVE